MTTKCPFRVNRDRVEPVAEADQILVTQEVFQRAQPDLKNSRSKAFQLEGFNSPIECLARRSPDEFSKRLGVYRGPSHCDDDMCHIG